MSVKIAMSNDIGKEILELLGIDTKHVQKANIIIEAGCPVKIEATHFIVSNNEEKVKEIVKNYTVIENKSCETCKHEISSICIDCDKKTLIGWEPKLME